MSDDNQEFVVSFTIDNKGAVKNVQTLNKELEKTGKIEKDNAKKKKLQEKINKRYNDQAIKGTASLTKTLTKIGIAYLSYKGVTSFFSSLKDNIIDTANAADILHMSTSRIGGIAATFSAVGASKQEAMDALVMMNQASNFAKSPASFGGGIPKSIIELNRLSARSGVVIDTTGNSSVEGIFNSTLKALYALRKDPAAQQNYAGQLGLMSILPELNRGGLPHLINMFTDMEAKNKEGASQALDLNNELERLNTRLKALATTLFVSLSPTITGIIDDIQSFVGKVQKDPNALDNMTKTLITTINQIVGAFESAADAIMWIDAKLEGKSKVYEANGKVYVSENEAKKYNPDSTVSSLWVSKDTALQISRKAGAETMKTGSRYIGYVGGVSALMFSPTHDTGLPADDFGLPNYGLLSSYLDPVMHNNATTVNNSSNTTIHNMNLVTNSDNVGGLVDSAHKAMKNRALASPSHSGVK